MSFIGGFEKNAISEMWTRKRVEGGMRSRVDKAIQRGELKPQSGYKTGIHSSASAVGAARDAHGPKMGLKILRIVNRKYLKKGMKP